jgi:hypothetical protein
MSSENIFFTDKCSVCLIEPHIIENIVKEGFTMEIKDIQELKALNKTLSGGLPYAVLVSFEHLADVSKEGKELIASKEFAENTVAKALLVDNIGHRLIGNFYMTINKPHIKTKVFTNRELALDWLRQELPTY